MKFLTTTFITLLTFTAFSKQFDLNKLQSSLNSTLTKVLKGSEYLDSAKFSFNPEATQPKLGKVDISFDMKTIPLSSNKDEEIIFKANIKTDLKDTDTQKKEFSVKGSVKIEGHSLSILKTVADNFGECTVITQSTIDTLKNDKEKNKEHINNIICITLNGIQEANTILALEKSLQDASQYAKNVFGDKQPNKEESILNQILSTLKISPSDLGLLLTADLNLKQFKTAGTSKITLKKDSISFTFEGKATLNSKEVQKHIDTVKSFTTELENEESAKHKAFEDQLYTIESLLGGFILPEEDDDF